MMEQEKEIIYIPIEEVIPNRFQPREVFDENSLKELAVSIKEHGVIQPIIVRKVNDKYEIVAGERRYKAAGMAELEKIPAIVREIDDKEASKIALLENLQRKDLNPMEEARTYQKILDLDNMTQENLAQTMGKTQSAVANKLRLLALPESVQEAVIKGQISERHARALLNLEDNAKKEELLKKIIETKMTVRDLEQEIKNINSGSNEQAPQSPLGEDLPEVPINEPTEQKEEPAQPEAPSSLEIPTIPEAAPASEGPSVEIPAPSEPTQSDTATPENTPKAPASAVDSALDLSMNSYINSDAIKPTVEDNSGKKEFGEVTIAPPEGETPPTDATTNLPKFINYGEIDNDSDDEEKEEAPNLSTSTSIDINDLKLNTNDINPEENKPPVDLDSLLKVNPAAQDAKPAEEKPENSFKFINPALEEKQEKQSAPKVDQPIIDNPMDLFVSPDVIPSVSSEQTKETSSEEQSSTEEQSTTSPSGESDLDKFLKNTPSTENSTEEKQFDENGDFIDDSSSSNPNEQSTNEQPYIYIPDSIKDKAALTSILMSDGFHPEEQTRIEPMTLKDAINEVRNTISILEKQNVQIESEEVDLPNNYQINIKIRKDEQ